MKVCALCRLQIFTCIIRSGCLGMYMNQVSSVTNGHPWMICPDLFGSLSWAAGGEFVHQVSSYAIWCSFSRGESMITIWVWVYLSWPCLSYAVLYFYENVIQYFALWNSCNLLLLYILFTSFTGHLVSVQY